MGASTYLLAGLFLPLFPLSMVFNRLLIRVRDVRLRALLLLVWPQIGVILVATTDAPAPCWLPAWALGTAALYAFRSLTLRDVGLWTAFIGTSAWAVLWIPATAGTESLATTYGHALGFSLPLVLLTLLAEGLRQRFGAAFTGLYGGLADAMPRFSVFLVLAVLAVIATPVFPGFFAMLESILLAGPAAALTLMVIWLLWSWTGARLLQGLLPGPPGNEVIDDIGEGSSWLYTIAFAGLAAGGTYLTGGL